MTQLPVFLLSFLCLSAADKVLVSFRGVLQSSPVSSSGTRQICVYCLPTSTFSSSLRRLMTDHNCEPFLVLRLLGVFSPTVVSFISSSGILSTIACSDASTDDVSVSGSGVVGALEMVPLDGVLPPAIRLDGCASSGNSLALDGDKFALAVSDGTELASSPLVHGIYRCQQQSNKNVRWVGRKRGKGRRGKERKSGFAAGESGNVAPL